QGRRARTRALHEDVAGCAVLDRPAVEGAHLRGGDGDQRAALISRTAAAMPTTSARATIAWPMFSSTIPGMAATGRTLAMVRPCPACTSRPTRAASAA